jgi:homoserine dehydrogenase
VVTVNDDGNRLDGTTDAAPETHTVRLELADEPGELLRALRPIADEDGNLLTVLHERGTLSPRGRVPVTVEFRCPPSRFTAIVDALETAGIAVVQADSEVYAGRLTVLLVGHVVDGDLSATLSEVERSPAASVVDLSLSASEGTSDVSAARLRLAVSPANGGASEALSAVRDAADRRNLRTIAPVETVEPTTGGDGTSTSHDPTVPTDDRRERTAAPAATTPQEDLRLAVMGAGVVGRAVCRAADDRGHRVVALADSTGAAVDADGLDTAAALDRKSERGRVGSGAPADALEAAYDVLVEATPTTLGDAQPGFGHAARALERDRSVVLANKGPVAERYADLQARASESDGRVRFGATVGGAVPLLSTIAGFGAANVDSVRGVFNGTANFVCSRMAAEGLSYEHVLAEAQDLGVAETDPSLDVEGTDAALKCVIVANVVSEREWTLADADVTGIVDLPVRAFESAAAVDRAVRLVGTASRDGVCVGPRLVPTDGPLAVEGTRTLVRVETDAAGTIDVSGRGAGGPETAAAILADVARLASD